MSEKKSGCKCQGTSSSKEWPFVIGSIVVYELAIIIVLLVLIFFDLDAPCDKPPSITTDPEEMNPTE